ncbi:hypothetical protein A6395_07240 [Exiguobacterium sp. SH31]|uniref:DUF2194 domain-containing protein n=1 Tax=unclassified Exiguobacterium TaxID=2644629 RepID=UPI0008BFA361|nr:MULTISPECIES: DUF2194 domain-containing protein [unclassified Exiguobacterium]OGX79306.1 hypothetical protein A6395_07240 [Exiguobacterium sp. SH31]TCI70349.1 DUF2194 domain-containing protein [Exiguobacterium sp. SH0S7]
MEKRTVISFSLFIVLFLVVVGAIQYLRIHSLHTLLPNVAEQRMNIDQLQGDASTKTGEHQLQVYLVRDEGDLAVNTADNLLYGLRYAKLDVREIEAGAVSSITPSPYSIIVFTGEQTATWPLQETKRFVEQGGNVVFANRFKDPAWNEVTGIEEIGEFVPDVYGLNFEETIFPGYVDLNPPDDLFVHSVVDFAIADEANVLLSAEGFPVLWEYEVGDGNVLYWNTTITDQKMIRGLFVQTLGTLPPAFVGAQAAIKLMYIDDFPAPVMDGKMKDVSATPLDKSVKDFFAEEWWQDMVDMAQDDDVIYTGAMIGTYEEEMELLDEQLIKRGEFPMLYFGRKLLAQGGEIGLHGYNHQSLVTADEPIDPTYGYIPWKDKDEMKRSLLQAESVFANYFPAEQLKSYVPPSNALNRTGVDAIAEALPELRTIASLYTGDPESGDFVQEFEFDTTHAEIYHFPRITSDYGEERGSIFQMVDAIANFGVFSHFIHPDDVIDPDRAFGRDWDTMFASLKKIVDDVNVSYPYLEAYTQHYATEKLITYQEADLNVTFDDETIYLTGDGLVNPSHFTVRLKVGQSLDTGKFAFGTVEQMEADRPLYLVQLTSANAEIAIKGDPQ